MAYSSKDVLFHADFPPKELLDGQEEGPAKWAAVAQWFRDHIPKPTEQELTAEQKVMVRWNVAEYIAEFKAGRVTCEAYVRLLVDRLLHYKCLNTHFVTVYSEVDVILRQAVAIDEKVKQSGVESVAPLYGLPVSMKGTAASADFKTSAGTGILGGSPACKDADMIALLKSRNAVIMGLTNVPEFAASFVTTNHTNGQTRNPHDLSFSPGGSSGGSGAAVAARIVPLSVSEDTGGSTRHPASMNGIFGYDPVRNHYPNEGNPGITSFCDQVGLHARTFDDIILADIALNGHADLHEQAKQKVAGSVVKVAFPKEYFVNYTVPKDAPNAFGVRSLRAAECIRDALDSVQKVLETSSSVKVVSGKEWHKVSSTRLGEVNALYHMNFGVDVNGKHFDPCHVQCHPFIGNVATWNEKFLSKPVCMGDVIADIRPCGASHNPGKTMLQSKVTDESQFRASDYQAFEAMKHWNRYFDDNDVDLICVPTQFSPSCKLDELAESKAPAEILQEDGTYKLEYSARLYHLNYPILMMFKEFPVPKLQVPVGKDAEGRTIGITFFGKSMTEHHQLYDDRFAQEFDIEFLHKVKVAVDLIHAETSLQRVEPALNSNVFA